MRRLLSLLRGKRTPVAEPQRLAEVFKTKYGHFRDLLESNSELLKIISEIQEQLHGGTVFGMAFVSSRATRAVFHATRMVVGLNALSGGRYAALQGVMDGLTKRIQALGEPGQEQARGDYVYGYDALSRDKVSLVGGKSANLGEVRNGAGLPTPEGFAISTAAYDALIRENDLLAAINKLRMEYECDDPATLVDLSEGVQRLFLDAVIPQDVERAILDAYEALSQRLGGRRPVVALRSSAIGEDSDLSYAGQYLSVLGVPPDRLLQNYRMVLASLFTPRAISYRLHKGVADADVAMSVACLTMVESVCSGVAYSRHPVRPECDEVLINAVWGLGPYAVDGVVPPDNYVFDHATPPRALRRDIAVKPVRLVATPDGGLTEEPVEDALQAAPCLTPEQADELARAVLALENHFGGPQDVEWAYDKAGKLVILQSRPLHLSAGQAHEAHADPAPGCQVLLQGGDTSCSGVGCGPVRIMDPDDDLGAFPKGGVLVARHSSPKFVLILQRAAAVVTEVGSVTGHMASLTREFRVPTLMNCPDARRILKDGDEVTVDATGRRVYQGRVESLLAKQEEEGSAMRGTPVHKALEALAQLVVPLNLLDPKSPAFTPENCRTLHDIMRLVHEFSYSEMFLINDLTSETGRISLKLDAPIPLDLHIIDLGGGLADVRPRDTRIRSEQVVSAPFRALLDGMLHEDMQHREPRPVNLGGLFSVISQQMLNPPAQGGERFGDRSYALASDKYLNFSSRVGYHYSIVDAYCGQTVNKNYVNFEFKGGAADSTRRNRRVRAIAAILEALDFAVDVTADRVVARFQKYEPALVAQRLEQLGRLLLFTRQMDMLMTDEASVQGVKACFLDGKCDYLPHAN
ncbi:MAG: PEP/pyruvate-binding domain-containing protein [Desulfovibrionaceae bacterium]